VKKGQVEKKRIKLEDTLKERTRMLMQRGEGVNMDFMPENRREDSLGIRLEYGTLQRLVEFR
jgi:hypothetical protein